MKHNSNTTTQQSEANPPIMELNQGKPTTKRFATVITLDSMTLDKTNIKSMQQMRWGVQIFKEYLKENNQEDNFESFSTDKLATSLRDFYASLRQQEGKIYSKSSYWKIRAAINRFLRSPPNNRMINIVSDREYMVANQVFRGILRKLPETGDVISKHRLAILDKDMRKLYSSGVLSNDAPLQLLRKVFIEISIHFDLRCQKKLNELTKKSIMVKQDGKGREYATIACDEFRKAFRVSMPKEMERKKIVYAQPNSPLCPVFSLKKYLSKLNDKCTAFFQKPRKINNPDCVSCWYENKSLGIDKIKTMMKIISQEAQLSQIYTNHSIRATSAAYDYVEIETEDKCLANDNGEEEMRHKVEIQDFSNFMIQDYSLETQQSEVDPPIMELKQGKPTTKRFATVTTDELDSLTLNKTNRKNMQQMQSGVRPFKANHDGAPIMELKQENSTTKRFATVTTNELDSLALNETNKKSVQQMLWGVRIFKEYLKENNEDDNFESFSTDKLATGLRDFYASLRQNEGNIYSKSSYINIRADINRFLKSPLNNRMINIISDPEYMFANQVFRSILKKLPKTGNDINDTIDELDSLALNKKNRKCIQQMQWGVRIFKEYLKENNEDHNFESFSTDKLATSLRDFYVSLQQNEGNVYSKSSCRKIRAAINRFLTSPPNNRTINIILDPEYTVANQVFRGILRKLPEMGNDINDTTDELDSLALKKTNRKSMQNRQWAVRIFKEYLKENNEDCNFESFSTEKLATSLRDFYASLRKKEGKIYTKSSYLNIRAAINRFLTSPPNNRMTNIMLDPEYIVANKVFRGILRKLRETGNDITKQGLAILDKDMRKLYSSGVLSNDTPLQLLRKVFIEISIHFGLRGREKLKELTKKSIIVRQDGKGREYATIAYDELRSTYRVSMPKEMERKKIIYARPNSPLCPVFSLKKYLSKLNEKCTAFFQKPREINNLECVSCWYKNESLGLKKIKVMMKIISQEAQLSQIYTNHCIIATSAAFDYLEIETEDKFSEVIDSERSDPRRDDESNLEYFTVESMADEYSSEKNSAPNHQFEFENPIKVELPDYIQMTDSINKIQNNASQHDTEFDENSTNWNTFIQISDVRSINYI